MTQTANDAWLINAARALQGKLGSGHKRQFTETERRILVAWRALASLNGVANQHVRRMRGLTRETIEQGSGRYLVFTLDQATLVDGAEDIPAILQGGTWVVDLSTDLHAIPTYKSPDA